MEAPSAAQIVTLHVRCSSNGVRSERRFDRGHTVGMIKVRSRIIRKSKTPCLKPFLLQLSGLAGLHASRS